MKHKFAKYFKKACRYSSDEQFSFKYFLNKLLLLDRYHQNCQVVLAVAGNNGLNAFKEFLLKLSSGSMISVTKRIFANHLNHRYWYCSDK